MGRPARDRDVERRRADDAIDAHLRRGPHKVRKLDAVEADALHRLFSVIPESYDDWEYETH